MITRTDIITAVTAALEPQDGVLAMWEAGSAAFGRLDTYSDIDLLVVVEDDRVQAAFDYFEAALIGVAAIEDVYVLPQPSWHGHEQKFYRLNGMPEWLMIDLAVMKISSENKFLTAELHGEPQVLFDKQSIIQPPAFDWAAHEQRIGARLADLQGFIRLLSHLPQKELDRGRPLDAMSFYQGLLLRPLVELLRMKYDPARYTFGMRYLEFDLPAHEVERLKPLVFVGDEQDLPKKIHLVHRWIETLFADLSQTYT